ncbi:MAG: hypothetical protein HOC70_15570 [Gammaproteobacteria bacterium]|nr:hypothetical protein [Gammaproteobacteria bacterium]
MRKCVATVLPLLLSSWVTASDLIKVVVDITPTETVVLERHEDADIELDGDLTEDVWNKLDAYDEFVVLEPDTLEQPEHATRVRLFYDESGLYLGIDMDQPADSLIARLSGRDRRRINRDSINVTLDTSGEGRYGYWFGINLGDSLSDGTLLPEKRFSNEWDGAWRGISRVTENGWSGEFHIPWGTVAMPISPGKRRIGLYMSRKVAYRDERYGWPTLPRTRPKFISEMQSLEVNGIDPKQQYSIYPFTSVTDDRFDDRVRYRSGADLFWRPSSNFQLTATVNPDFGAVESDDVVINLTATETFFPEKRLFFVEGQDVFVTSPRARTQSMGVGNTGTPTTLINTRRIGGKPLEPELGSEYSISDRELDQPVDLLAAMKVTGQAGRFRYGVLAAFEDDFKFDAALNDDPIHLEGNPTDYGVARILYEDAPGGAYKALGLMTTATLNEQRDAMTHGLDAHYLTAGGKLKVDGQLYLSDIEGEESGTGGFVDFHYNFRQGVEQRLGIEWADRHVDINDLGFQSRNDYWQIRTAHTRTSSNLSWARNNQFDVRGFIQKNGDGYFTRGGIFLANRTTFHNLHQFTIRANFFPESYDDLNSFGNGTYRIEENPWLGFSFDSDRSKPFSYGMGIGTHKEKLGGDTIITRLNFTWRPSDRFALTFHTRHSDRRGWLLHQEDRNMTAFDAEQWTPRLSAEYFVSARQQLRFSLQWVGIKARERDFYLVPDRPGDLIEVLKPEGPSDSFSLSQMTMQLRYRWEIAPLSDVFLVYTRLVDHSGSLKSFSDAFSDGYDDPMGNALVFKIRYRFGS